jgi:hypothetical protein
MIFKKAKTAAKMKERTKAEQILVLEALISERTSIIDSIFEKFENERLNKSYKEALSDEIHNHNLAREEYIQGLKKLT